MSSSFPKGFLIGTLSSAYQIEGAYNEDGKGENMWDHLLNVDYPKMDNANVSCDSYHKYKEDVKLLKDAGFNHYRFSISWSRILPDGELTTAGVNQKGVEYYKNLIAELKKNNIEPVVTIYHWDLPQRLQDGYGGWTNSLMIDFMEDYADLLFSHFGDTVKWWVTINEPTMVLHGYEYSELMQLAPAKSLYSPANYIVAHNLLRAHARIYKLYDTKYRASQNGKVGINLVTSCFRPKDPDSKADVQAVDRAYQFYLGLFAHPIFTKEGDYPSLVRKVVDENSKKEGRSRSRLPTFTKEEKESLIGASDFFGMNHYVTQLCSPTPDEFDLSCVNYYISQLCSMASSICKKQPNFFSRHYNPTESFKGDVNVVVDFMKTVSVPTGFREILNYIKTNYGNPPVFVCENGYGTNQETSLEDDERIKYFREYLQQLLNAINEDKCNVIAYTAYAIMDLFEWDNGFAWKYGLVKVDFDDKDKKRTTKKSYDFFKQLMKTGVIPEPSS